MLLMFAGMILESETAEKFDILYTKYRKLVLKIALGILDEKMNAEDAVVETYIKLIEHMDAVSDPYSAETKYYLVRIAKSVCFDMNKKNSKSPVVDVLTGDDTDDEEENTAETEGVYIEDFSNLEKEDIVKAIESLPEMYRDILVLRYLNKFTDTRLAAALGLSTAAARKRLQRARQKLREILIESGLIDDRTAV